MKNNENTAATSNERTNTSSSSAKEKKSGGGGVGWFHSLTRRKKTQSQLSLENSLAANSRQENASGSGTMSTNNNNESPPPSAAATTLLVRSCNGTLESGMTTHTCDNAAANCSCNSINLSRKRKEEKNAFQRFRKKMGIRFPSLRRRKTAGEDENSATTDASAEFLTHSPVHEPLQFNFQHNNSRDNYAVGSGGYLSEEANMIPFTHDFKRFIKKKWLEREDPNVIMYEASCEMLSQVWYWGEISRRDAQKSLTDKPTGSFLVRDSESSGCQFTLSFRIVNVTLHYRLEYRNNYWHFEELQYESVVEMIEDILYRCTNDNFVCFVKVPNEIQPPFPVILKYPLSRYLQMPKLQDLCRRVIQHSTAHEEIAKLPIPPGLQEYLAERRELVF